MPNARLKKQLLSLYAEPEQATALRQLSERTRVPVQVYLREGVDYVLRKHQKQKKERRS
jgi:hypothetical protein